MRTSCCNGLGQTDNFVWSWVPLSPTFKEYYELIAQSIEQNFSTSTCLLYKEKLHWLISAWIVTLIEEYFPHSYIKIDSRMTFVLSHDSAKTKDSKRSVIISL